MINDEVDCAMAGLLVGIVVGATTGAIATYTRMDDKITTEHEMLRAVGIDRVEYCHNVHSNWYEIVWREEE